MTRRGKPGLKGTMRSHGLQKGRRRMRKVTRKTREHSEGRLWSSEKGHGTWCRRWWRMRLTSESLRRRKVDHRIKDEEQLDRESTGGGKEEVDRVARDTRPWHERPRDVLRAAMRRKRASMHDCSENEGPLEAKRSRAAEELRCLREQPTDDSGKGRVKRVSGESNLADWLTKGKARHDRQAGSHGFSQRLNCVLFH